MTTLVAVLGLGLVIGLWGYLTRHVRLGDVMLAIGDALPPGARSGQDTDEQRRHPDE